MRNFLNCTAFLLFGLSIGMAYAFVFDVEPISPEKAYSIERDIYLRSDESWNSDFPSFQEWMNCRDAQEQRFNDWISGLSREIGVEAAIMFDPWYQVQDTSTGHAACAPSDWAKGERD